MEDAWKPLAYKEAGEACATSSSLPIWPAGPYESPHAGPLPMLMTLTRYKYQLKSSLVPAWLHRQLYLSVCSWKTFVLCHVREQRSAALAERGIR
jgi:hypothetical protein